MSVGFLAELAEAVEAAGGSDADEAQWRAVEVLLAGEESGENLAFDPALLLGDAVAASRWASVPSAHADPG